VGFAEVAAATAVDTSQSGLACLTLYIFNIGVAGDGLDDEGLVCVAAGGFLAKARAAIMNVSEL
jgi:hypothetical protein